MRSLEARLQELENILEKRASTLTKSALRCICYPPDQVPSAGFPILTAVAFSVKCPLHGDRFTRRGEIYMAKWLREKKYRLVLNPLCAWYTDQYRKAFLASFPSDLWPAEEEEEKQCNAQDEQIKIYLRLKNGTRFQVCQYYFPLRNNNGGPSSDVEQRRLRRVLRPEQDWGWQRDTLCTMGRILSARGRIINFSWLYRKE